MQEETEAKQKQVEQEREGQHERQVSEPKFWRKLGRFAKRAGRDVLEKALILFYVSKSEHLPGRVKAMIFGALAYFISTVDAIPDIMPALGFVDDLGILVAAVSAIAAWVSPDIQQKVDEKLKGYFADESSNESSSESSSVVDKRSE